MDYYVLEETLQVLFEEVIPLSRAQNRHVRQVCVGVLLAGSSQLTKIARWLKQATQQDSRVPWLRRLFEAGYMTQEYVYHPFVKRVLERYQPAAIHLVMDRTPLAAGQTDLLSVSLSFRKRAIPLVWGFMAHGMSDYETQRQLITGCEPLLPAYVPVVVHGDNEFGSVRMMQFLRHLQWDFVVGQANKNYYRCSPDGEWQTLATLPVTKRQAVYRSQVELTKDYAYGPLNLFAFYQPRFSNRRRKRDITYCATSLPITPTVRRVGRHRWGIECCFKDFKSSGWNVQLSDLTHPQRREGLFTTLSLTYLWATCLGRWLCKTGQRAWVDAKAQRHLSLFRIGWDWLVHRYNLDSPCPTLLTLYP